VQVIVLGIMVLNKQTTTKKSRFRLDMRKKFFTINVVRHQKRLPRVPVDALSLEVFRARLNGALCSVVWWEVFCSSTTTCIYCPLTHGSPCPFFSASSF